MRCCSATACAVAGLRDAIATGLNSAFRYASRWQSRMMNLVTRQPIRESLRRGSVGRWFRTRSWDRDCDMALSLPRVDEEREPRQQLRRERRAVGVVADDPPLAVAPVLDQGRLVGLVAAVKYPVLTY